jgi:hypothetical protein
MIFPPLQLNKLQFNENFVPKYLQISFEEPKATTAYNKLAELLIANKIYNSQKSRISIAEHHLQKEDGSVKQRLNSPPQKGSSDPLS